MSCATVTRVLSDGDGRVSRRRDVRAHLRSCPGCRAFRDEIKSREYDLAALAPLPAVVATGMLEGLLGGSQGVTGGGLAAALGGGTAKTIGVSAAAKGVATAAVVAAIGVTAADQAHVIHLDLPGEQGSAPVLRQSTATPAPAGRDSGAPDRSGRTSIVADARKGEADVGAAEGRGVADRHVSVAGHAHGQPNAAANEELPGYNPGSDHPRGREHEKQHPPAADMGQEAAAAHEPPPQEPRGDDGGDAGAEHAVKPTKPSSPSPPSAPGPPTSAPPEEAPANPPSAAPGSPAPKPPQSAEKGPPQAGGKPSGIS